MEFKGLTDMRLKHFIAHGLHGPEGIKPTLFQIETIPAIQIAGRPGGLGHDMERTGYPGIAHALPLVIIDTIRLGIPRAIEYGS
jgi:hypothetical protein